MNCPICNAECDESQKFCTKCGSSIQAVEAKGTGASGNADAQAAAIGSGMLVSDYHHAKEDLATARDAHAAAVRQVRNMVIFGIVGAVVYAAIASSQTNTMGPLFPIIGGILLGWGLSGVIGIMRKTGYFVTLNPIGILVILTVTLAIAMVIGAPLFVYDIYQLKKAEKVEGQAQATLEAIVAKAAQLGVQL